MVVPLLFFKCTCNMWDEEIRRRFEKGQDIAFWMALNPDYNKLNKVKKTSPEAFFYYFRALELMRLVGERGVSFRTFSKECCKRMWPLANGWGIQLWLKGRRGKDGTRIEWW